MVVSISKDQIAEAHSVCKEIWCPREASLYPKLLFTQSHVLYVISQASQVASLPDVICFQFQLTHIACIQLAWIAWL